MSVSASSSPSSSAASLPIMTKETTRVKVVKDGMNKSVNQYVLLKKLGTGTYGKVKLAHNTDDNQLYAIKIFKKKALQRKRVGMRKGGAFNDVLNEIEIMKNLDHKNIVKLYEVINDPDDDRLFLVIEYNERGAVMQSEMECDPLPEEKAKKYFIDVINGLEYLHSRNIIHRDLKPENLLLTAEDTVKIGDFSVSIYYEEGDDNSQLRRTVGSPVFLAPELCASETPRIIGTAIDIWALGVTLYFFIFGRPPFQADIEVQLYDNIKNNEVQFPHKINAELQNLIERLLEKDPEKRITIPEIKKHPWLKNK